MRLSLAFLALPLGACAASAPPASAPALRCNPAPAQAYVGQVASQDVGSRMMAASGATDLRWVGFGRMVTMEFREGRLTVHLDQANRVTSAACT